jgi:hypothetical protein
MPKTPFPWMMLVLALAAGPAACKEKDVAASPAGVSALLAGRYDNAAQVAENKMLEDNRSPQHVTIAIEPASQPNWAIWRVHMDVDPAVAQAAGSDTSLDAVWAMNLANNPADQGLRLIPYTLNPSVDPRTVNAAAFDQAQWLSLEACMLTGVFASARIVAETTASEMCVAESMGLGGKRAFLPGLIEREGDWLHVQIVYFGKPWRVDARRMQ